jgi:hypothetical protein
MLETISGEDVEPHQRTKVRWITVYIGQAVALLLIWALWYSAMIGAHVNSETYTLPGQQSEVNYGHHSALATVLALCAVAVVTLSVAVWAARTGRLGLVAVQALLIVAILIPSWSYLTWAMHILFPITPPSSTTPPPAPGPIGSNAPQGGGGQPCWNPGNCPGDG